MEWPTFGLPLLSLEQVMTRLGAAAVVLAVHGWAAAWIAVRLGDRGPSHDGRVTLNPLAHLDIVGLVHAIFFRVLWMRPVDVDPRALRRGAIGTLAAVVGPALVVCLLSAGALAARRLAVALLEGSGGLTLSGFLGVVSDIAFVSALASVLPWPVFVGALWLKGRGASLRWLERPASRWVAVVVLIGMSTSGVTTGLVRPALAWWRVTLGY